MWGSLPAPLIVKILSYLRAPIVAKLYFSNKSLQKYGRIELLPQIFEFNRLSASHAFLRYAHMHPDRKTYQFPFIVCMNGCKGVDTMTFDCVENSTIYFSNSAFRFSLNVTCLVTFEKFFIFCKRICGMRFYYDGNATIVHIRVHVTVRSRFKLDFDSSAEEAIVQ